jgi:hypothetical protein
MQYFLRLWAAHLCELVVLADRSYPHHGDVQQFVDDLPEDARAAFGRILATARTTDDFHDALFTARNHVFHYPAPASGGVKKALRAAADLDSGLHEGDRLAEFRADFADDVAVQYWGFAQDEKALREILVALLPLSQDACHFIGAALDVYLGSRADGVVLGPETVESE